MTEEELRKDYYADRPSEPYSDDDRPSDWANIAHYAEENLENAFKRIEELEEKISVLLSCKNCPDNKGGFICRKEYDDKCLGQKIQYINELKEENALLKKENDELKSNNQFLNNLVKEKEQRGFEIQEDLLKEKEELEKENAELKKQQFSLRNERNTFLAQNEQYEKDLIDFNENLIKTKDFLRRIIDSYNHKERFSFEKDLIEAEQFLREVEE